MHIGLYFGSFNPIHIGHLIIATYVINTTKMQQIWLVVSPQNPLKPSKTLLNEYHRLHLVQSSLEGENKIRASNIEFQLPKPSFTIDTLTHLQEKYPQHQFSIIMGSDSFCNLPKWKNYEKIIKDYSLYIYKRQGYEIDNDMGAQVQVIDAPILQISSTQIRNLIKAGKLIRYLVPDVVKEEIERNGYYR